eukprot:TRINITY_DN10147_c0_g1_i2.p3 TRINITY_DN10147_c0_g1~~TRINITY_DN10147_c0_g1_i2.p3  ORF type:complete len:108 (+),score=4.02 TRINITY_DN10147_c0_g1_i2:154-477(+)
MSDKNSCENVKACLWSPYFANSINPQLYNQALAQWQSLINEGRISFRKSCDSIIFPSSKNSLSCCLSSTQNYECCFKGKENVFSPLPSKVFDLLRKSTPVFLSLIHI